jgi:N-acetylglucosaminyl-diphospho-decaprenol L-rhamnosyltransferase
MSTIPTVAIVTVSYNTCDWLARCLGSVPAAAATLDHEVIVVDNASSDGSADMVESSFPKARLVRSTENLGFARGVNLGVARAEAEYVLLVNPDGELRPGAVDALVAFATAHPEYVVCGGRTVSPDGDLDPRSCWAAPSLWSVAANALLLSSVFRGSQRFDPEAMGGFGRDREQAVDIVTGCLLLIRRADWEALGGFDERFFMYGEDADLCLRAAADGRRCAITPAAEMVHAVGASSAVRPDKLELLFKGRITLMRKHWSRPRAALGILLVLLGVRIRRLGERVRRTPDGAWTELWARRRQWRAGYGPVSAAGATGDAPTGRSTVRVGSKRVTRLTSSILDPRSLVQVVRLLHYYHYTHVAERPKVHQASGVRLAPNVSLANGERITIGARSRVGARTHLWAGDHHGRITIGADCNIAPFCVISASNYGIEKGTPFLDQAKVEEDITIGDDVWLGASVVIVAGVTIGSGTVVAAGSVVTRDLPPGVVAGGIPAKVLRER